MRALDRLTLLPGRAPRMPAMEGLRAYAAGVVFLVHFFGAWAHETRGIDLDQVRLGETSDLGLALVTWLHRSHYGVDLFFFLSGYLVLGLVSRSEFHYGRFLRDRLVRLYPVFLFTTLAIAVAFFGWQQVATQNLLANLALLNAIHGLDVAPINTATWSLCFELIFYAGFPLILLARRAGSPVRGGHVLALAVLALAATSFSRGYAWRGVAFFAGAWLACQDPARMRRLAARVPDAAVLALFLAATTSYAFFPRFESFLWIFVLPCTALALSVLHGDGFLARLFRAPLLRAFGNVSFSFYLIHGFAVGVVFHLVRGWLPAAASGPAALLACVASCAASFALATALAVALFLSFERPYFVWKARRASPRADRAHEPLLAQPSRP